MTGISGAAAARAADAMLQTLGGTEVTSAVCGGGNAGRCRGGVGLVDPGVEQADCAGDCAGTDDRDNGPRRRIEMLAGQAAMAEQVSQRNVASADVLFETALGVVYGGEMFHIEGFIVERLGGVAYLYRVRRWLSQLSAIRRSHQLTSPSGVRLHFVELLLLLIGDVLQACRRLKTVFIWRCGRGWRH
jgi:hypothetical protein